ncbi:MAG: prolyl oligopeptidase family serine peptidase [Prolixibacteraceae bacterium]
MRKLTISLLFMLLIVPAFAQTRESAIGSSEEVIYGRKNGMALTLVVLTPKAKSNNRAIILVISAGLKSNFDMATEWAGTIAQPFLMKGYTVFEVCHGSAPKYNNIEIVSDLHRAVQFIRYNAVKFNIEPNKIGMTGASSGGFLSLMMGTTGFEPDLNAKDPIDRVVGNVQAVACFFPPTDFLNFGKTGTVSMGTGLLSEYRAAFEFSSWNNQERHFEMITDSVQLLKIGRQISPIYQVSAQSAPTLIAHGDMDELIPLQQSQIFIQKLKEFNVPCELMIKQGGTHKVWPDILVYLMAFSDWFDKYLK